MKYPFKFVQRIYWPTYNTPRKRQAIVDEFKLRPGACDEIALFEVGYCLEDRFVPLSEIRDRQNYISQTIAFIRHHGVARVHLNIMNIYGHGDSVSDPVHRPDFPTMVGHDGTQGNAVACPNTPEFNHYLQEKCRLLAACGPDVIWLDDDIRMQAHNPVSFGCFCPVCLSMFACQTGVDRTRQQLHHELLIDHFPQPNRLREQWLLFNRRTIRRTLATAREAIHQVDPEIVIGFMVANFAYNAYSAPDLVDFGEAIKNRHGALFYRPGSGFWQDHVPAQAIYKGLNIGRLIGISHPDAECLSEVEGWPYQTLEKTPAMTALEIVSHIAIGGVTGVTINLSECMGNDNREQNAYLEMLEKNRERFKALAAAIQGHRQVGFLPYADKLVWAANDTHSDLAEFVNQGVFNSEKLIELGIPLTFDGQGQLGTVISGQAAKNLNKEELQCFAARGLYLDGEALSYLAQEFPVAELFGVNPVAFPRCGVYEKNTDLWLNGESTGYVRTVGSFLGKKFAGLENRGARSLTDLYSYNHQFLGLHGATVFANKIGGRTAVMGFAPWENIHFLHKRQQLTEVLDWLCGQRLPVKIMSPYKIAQTVWGSEQSAVIVLFNMSMQRVPEIKLQIRCQGLLEELADNGLWQSRGPLPLPEQILSAGEMPPWSAKILRVTLSAENSGIWQG